jgi:hypothetical protein
MRVKSWLVAAFCALVFAAVSAGSAFAGEVTGNGKGTGMAEHANSECGFSGREDENAAGSPLRTQTPHEVWLNPAFFPVPPGGLVVNPDPGTPGQACNGHTSPRK